MGFMPLELVINGPVNILTAVALWEKNAGMALVATRDPVMVTVPLAELTTPYDPFPIAFAPPVTVPTTLTVPAPALETPKVPLPEPPVTLPVILTVPAPLLSTP
jgi:hypothetical protein